MRPGRPFCENLSLMHAHQIAAFIRTLIELLKALALFAWPVLIAWVVWRYRMELQEVLKALPNALGRVTEAEALGVKVQLRELQESTAQAQSEVLTLEASAEVVESGKHTTNVYQETPSDQIRRKAVSSLSSALLLTAGYIEREIKELLATNGLLINYLVPPQGARILEDRKLISTSLREAIDTFFSIRNSVVHTTATDTLTAEVVTSGIGILEVLQSIPRSKHEIIRAEVSLFSDPNGSVPVLDATGVMLRGIDEHDRPSHLIQIFPTTRPMRVGSFVSWEWDGSKSWGRTWFRNPDNNEINTAWSSSAEFVGRDLSAL